MGNGASWTLLSSTITYGAKERNGLFTITAYNVGGALSIGSLGELKLRKETFVGITVILLWFFAGCGGDGTSASIYTEPAEDAASTTQDGTGSGMCVPNCDGRTCGPSGCPGYSCGMCAPGSYCGKQFSCVEGECEPGTTKCDGEGVSVCAGDGSAWEATYACPDGLICEDGACAGGEDVCVPGESVCQGGGVAICNNDGSGYGAPAPCPTGMACVDGKCEQSGQLCTPGLKMCQANTIVTCNTDGTAWEQPFACPDGTACVGAECQQQQVKDCSDLLFCMAGLNCGDPGASCLAQCFGEVSNPVAALGMDVYACIFDLCGKWGPGEPCFQTQQITGCAAEFAACKNSRTCQPDCAGKECGSNGCGGQCGICPAGVACVNGKCDVGAGCGDIVYQGCCDGNTLKWCENGQLKTKNCNNQPNCGWHPMKDYYDCGTMGQADPSGQFPKECSGGGGDETNCGAIIDCALACNFQQNCVWGCYEKGDQQAKDLAQNLTWCIGEACGMVISQECLFKALGDQCNESYNACLSDN